MRVKFLHKHMCNQTMDISQLNSMFAPNFIDPHLIT